MKGKRKFKPIDVIEGLDSMVGGVSERQAMIKEEVLYAEIAAQVFRARTAAGLTQAALAELVGTSRKAIARLEDADDGGRSLAILHKIAAVLNCRLEIRLLPGKRRERAA